MTSRYQKMTQRFGLIDNHKSYVEYLRMERELAKKVEEFDYRINQMVTREIGYRPSCLDYGFIELEAEKFLKVIEEDISQTQNALYILFGIIALLTVATLFNSRITTIHFAMLGLISLTIIFGIPLIMDNTREKWERKFSIRFPKYQEYKQTIKEYDDKFKNLFNEYKLQYKSDLRDKDYWKKYWLNLTGKGFEIELAKLFLKLGFQTELTGASGDKGIDIVMNKEKRKIIVQCKAHKNRVGPSIIRDLYGTLIASKANIAVLAALSGFTEGVYEFAKDKPIVLISLDEIVYMSIMESL